LEGNGGSYLISKIIIISAILLSIGFTAQSTKDNVEMGPFDVSFEMSNPNGYDVEVEGPVAFEKFTGYPFRIESLATHKLEGMEIELPDASIQIKVHDYAEAIDISSNGLRQQLDHEEAWYWKEYGVDYKEFTISGTPGILATVNLDRPVYLASYSPDGRGMKGHVIVFIQSFYPWEVTEPFLRNLKVSRED